MATMLHTKIKKLVFAFFVTKNAPNPYVLLFIGLTAFLFLFKRLYMIYGYRRPLVINLYQSANDHLFLFHYPLLSAILSATSPNL